MNIKKGYVYEDQDGICYKAEDVNGEIVLTNPSYPFPFIPQVFDTLTEVGTYEQFKKSIKKEEITLQEGAELTVKVESEELKVIE